MVIIVNIGQSYNVGMNCCQIRQCAYQAWIANRLLNDADYRNSVKCLVAVAKGVVVGVFCIKAVAETINANGNRAVAFWLVCVENECAEVLKSKLEALYKQNRRFFPQGIRYFDFLCKCACAEDSIPIIPIDHIPHHGPSGSEKAKRTCDKFK